MFFFKLGGSGPWDKIPTFFLQKNGMDGSPLSIPAKVIKSVHSSASKSVHQQGGPC